MVSFFSDTPFLLFISHESVIAKDLAENSEDEGIARSHFANQGAIHHLSSVSCETESYQVESNGNIFSSQQLSNLQDDNDPPVYWNEFDGLIHGFLYSYQ
jgi:hypothetical protein